MKRKKTLMLALSLLTFAAIPLSAVTSCGQSTTTSVNQFKPRITIGGDGSGWGRVGETIQLNVSVVGDSENEVTWSTEDASIATVNEQGVVTCVGVGSCNIVVTSVKDNSKKASTQINVSDSLERRLVVYSMPSKTKYKVGETLSFSGLSVMGYGFVNGVKDPTYSVSFDINDLTFSVNEGTALSQIGENTINVSCDGYVSTSFSVSVSETVVEKRLYIEKFPSTTTYIIGSQNQNEFSSSGLRVSELTYVDYVLDETRALSSNEYDLSIDEGYEFTEEGSVNVDITSRYYDVAGTSFSVMVYTQDFTIRDIVKNLQETHNFTAEVLNNVGTTADTTGFHYLRTYTENYYDDIEYQNVNNGTEIEFSTTQMKSHTGYMVYGELGSNERAIISYNENADGMIEGGKVVSKGANIQSWWDRSASLVRLFTLFDISDIPTTTFNGKYLSFNIEVVENDNDMGDETADKYPLVASFLDYCGWSSNLITIMNRFSVSINDDGNLSMLAEFGSYGTTELIVRDIGTSRNTIVEAYYDTITPDYSVDREVEVLAEGLRGNNYTTVAYENNVGINKNNVSSYFTEDYYYNVANNLGLAKVTVDGQDYIQQFILNDGVYEPAVDENKQPLDLIEIEDGKTFPEKFNELVPTGNYIGLALRNVIGTDSENTGLLNTFSLYQGLSTSTQRTYQSFDENALEAYNSYLGITNDDFDEEIDVSQNRLWFMATYYSDTYTLDNLDTLEIWNINGVTLSGSVIVFADIGKTSVDWIESGIVEQEELLSSTTVAE